jgi:uncharacterized RDD family membrane protein YckC
MMPPAVRYAGFWRRFTAVVLDHLLFSSLILLLLYWAHGPAYLQWAMHQTGWTYSPLDAAVNGVILPLTVILFWMRMRATPGKLLLSCVVVDATTCRPLRAHQAVLRLLGYLVSALPLCLGFLWAAWDSRKQAWHDKIAGSIVIVEDEADRFLREWNQES